jgi:DNA-binding transcriptional LysR family regulator
MILESGTRDKIAGSSLAQGAIGIRHLRIFEKVAEIGTYSGAASALRTSTPGLIKQVRDLERILGVCLFLKHGKCPTLTPLGKRFLQSAKQLIREWELLLNDAERWKYSDARCMVCGVPEYIAASSTFAGFVRQFFDRHPGFPLKIMETMKDIEVDQVLDGELDCGFTISPPKHRGIRWSRVASNPVQVILSEDHPLADEVIVNPLLLDWSEYLSLDRQSYTTLGDKLRGYVRDNLELNEPDAPAMISRVSMLLEAISAGQGFALSWGLSYSGVNRGYVSRPLSTTGPNSGLYLYWRAGDEDVQAKSLDRAVRELGHDIPGFLIDQSDV